MPQKIEFGIVIVALNTAYELVRTEVENMIKLAQSSPATVATRIIESLQEYQDSTALLLEAMEFMEELQTRVRTLEKSNRLNFIKQKRWRVIACRACLNEAKVKDLIHQAFFDVLDKPEETPQTEQELDDELHRLVERLEEFEAAEKEFGELRVIDIDGQ